MKEQARELAYKEWWDFEAREYLVDVFKNDHEFVDKCLLRYIFVKCMDRCKTDDVLFISKPTQAAMKMIEEDLQYMKVHKPTASQVVQTLDKYLAKALERCKKLNECTLRDEVSGEKLTDSERRYQYLGLDKSTLALSLDYHAIGYDGKEDYVIEGFASSMKGNHTFIKWCSAFPDVDHQSIGSLWDTLDLNVSTKLILLNPPFDLTIMNYMFTLVRKLSSNNPHLTFFIIIPDWKGWKEASAFAMECYEQRKVDKYSLSFKSTDGERINACNTLWLYYGCKRTIDEKGKVVVVV